MMKRLLRIWCLLGLGTLLLVGGFGLLLVDDAPTYAQSEGDDEGGGEGEDEESTDEEVADEDTSEASATEEPTAPVELTYVGTEECSSCHRSAVQDHRASAHGLALQDVEDDKAPILADFSQGEDLRQVTFPNDTAPRAFTLDDIKFAVGVGRYAQAYIYEVERRVYRVFPAQWNVQMAAWQPLTLANAWDDPAYDWNQNCAYCHVTGLETDLSRWEEDGVQCETCHGPGSLHLEVVDEFGRNANDEELAQIRTSINSAIDPQVCGQCHSRGTATNGGYPFPLGYLPGATLNEYTTLFTVDNSDTTHFWVSGHAKQDNMQYNEWVTSSHATSLSKLQADDYQDPTCLTCHSADYVYTEGLITEVKAGEREGALPDSLTIETAQYGITCTSCHNPHADPEDALPANLVQEPYALCVSCHSNTNIAEGSIHHPNQEMYEGTALIEGIAAVPGVHFIREGGPDCLTCHTVGVSIDGTTQASHALQLIMSGMVATTPELTDTCSSCHAEQATPAAMQQLIDDIQRDTQARLEAARAAVTETTPAWVTQALDVVEGDGSLGIHNYEYTDLLLDAVDAELGLFPVEP